MGVMHHLMVNNMEVVQVINHGKKMDALVGLLAMMLKNFWINIMLIIL
jgi:hypothetical protein